MSARQVDTSALARLGASPDAPVWAERIDRGLAHQRRHSAGGQLLSEDFDLIAEVTGQATERVQLV